MGVPITVDVLGYAQQDGEVVAVMEHSLTGKKWTLDLDQLTEAMENNRGDPIHDVYQAAYDAIIAHNENGTGASLQHISSADDYIVPEQQVTKMAMEGNDMSSKDIQISQSNTGFTPPRL